MVKQGDIIKVSLDPRTGHEQAGYRPAIVISNKIFNQKTNLTIACPITNTNNHFPLHIPLDGRTTTTGVILCEHVRALDLDSRPYVFIEKAPSDIVKKVVETVTAEIELD